MLGALEHPRHERKPLCPPLPPEIWSNIFRYHTDLAHLWGTCRRVSPLLRACAERAIGENYLGCVRIEFLLAKHNLGGRRVPPEPRISVEFARLGKGVEEGTAWFKGHMITTPWLKHKSHELIMQRWQENVEKRKPELPNYTICIGDMVNDTDIPCLRVNIEDFEVCFNWRGMLRSFFREQARLDTLNKEWKAYITNNTHRIPRERNKNPKNGFAAWQEIQAEMRKDVRRERLKEHYRNNPEMVWAIDSLKYFENIDSSKWRSASPKLLPNLPGAGLGERWFGSTNLVQELYLDECSSMNRIDTQLRLVSKRNGG